MSHEKKKPLSHLGIHHQDPNTNEKPHPPKYMLDYDKIGKFLVDKITFPSSEIRKKKIGELRGLYQVNPEDAPNLD